MRVIVYSGAEPLALMSQTGAEHTSYTSTDPEKADKAEDPTVTHDTIQRERTNGTELD